MKPKRITFKQKKKKIDKKCYFCEECDYSLLDVHRITYGANGGKYKKYNTVTVCSNCHRRIHSGSIKIDRYYQSTKGTVLHYFIEGKEFWQ